MAWNDMISSKTLRICHKSSPETSSPVGFLNSIFKWLLKMMLQKKSPPAQVLFRIRFSALRVTMSFKGFSQYAFSTGFFRCCFKRLFDFNFQMAVFLMELQGFYEFDFSNGFLRWCFKGFSNSILKWLFKMKLQGFFKLDFWNGFLRCCFKRLFEFNIRMAF